MCQRGLHRSGVLETGQRPRRCASVPDIATAFWRQTGVRGEDAMYAETRQIRRHRPGVPAQLRRPRRRSDVRRDALSLETSSRRCGDAPAFQRRDDVRGDRPAMETALQRSGDEPMSTETRQRKKRRPRVPARRRRSGRSGDVRRDGPDQPTSFATSRSTSFKSTFPSHWWTIRPSPSTRKAAGTVRTWKTDQAGVFVASR